MTLKLPDGSIDVHRMILAAVSPVFERMFYGDFKEGKSVTVELPNDSSKTMKLLIDFVYYGNCELNNLDDIFPLLEVFDRYQINKLPFYHSCSEFILANLDSSNYLVLLPKFSSVMSEEGIRKAACKVMHYTNNDFITKFDSTKDLPEEVLLHLLQMDITNHEVDVFDFLVKWHDYQSKDLGRSLRLTKQLFQYIRYSLIIPQILSSRIVKRCDLVNNQIIGDAYHYIYNSCKPLGEYDSTECSLEPASPSLRNPRCSLEIKWLPYNGSNIKVQYDISDNCMVTFYYHSTPFKDYVIKSTPLKNGIYTFSVLSIAPLSSGNTYSCPNGAISVAISAQSDRYLYWYPLFSGALITVYVHDEYMFLKLIEGNKVKSTTGIHETYQLSICICNLLQYSNLSCSFNIKTHV